MKILAIRMSSLGDVILSTAFLENLPPEAQVDWLISSEFAFVLRGHPRIRKLIEFDKKTGFIGWIKLIRSIQKEDYSFRVDLHSTLRTRVARCYWFMSELFGNRVQTDGVSKQRIRFWGYLTFKSYFPHRFRPNPFWKRFALMAKKLSFSKDPLLRPPSYLPLILKRQDETAAILERYGLKPKAYYAIVPASRWKSKEWDHQNYVSLCSTLHALSKAEILILGRENDLACKNLKFELEQRKIPFVSALNETDFQITALLLQNSIAYVGGDTGLAHLSEAVGTPATMIFGPTRPDLGFGPWRKQSRSIFNDVGCAPCSKDGKFCYRFTERYACLKQIDVERVRGALL